MEIKRIITLQGKSDSGKTTTLKELIKYINTQKDFELVLHNRCYQHCMETNHSDAWVVYKHNGKIVTIITAGDGLSATKEKLAEIERNFNKKYNKTITMDLLICASHNGKGQINFFLSCDKDYKIIAKKPNENDDLIISKDLFNLINKITVS